QQDNEHQESVQQVEPQRVRAEHERPRCTLATSMAGSPPPAMKWHPALMLTYRGAAARTKIVGAVRFSAHATAVPARVTRRPRAERASYCRWCQRAARVGREVVAL